MGKYVSRDELMGMVQELEIRVRGLDRVVYDTGIEMDRKVKEIESLTKTIKVEKHRVYELRHIISKYRDETKAQGMVLKEYEIAYEALTGERHGKGRETEVSLEDAGS
jgi:hypothetical protein